VRTVDSPRAASPIPLFLVYGVASGCLAWLFCSRFPELSATPSGAVALLVGMVSGVLNVRLHRHAASAFAGGRDLAACAMVVFGLIVMPWCLAGLISVGSIAFSYAVRVDTPQTVVTQHQPIPAAAPGPTPTAPPPEEPAQLSDEALARLPLEVEQANAALDDGDLDRAMGHLSSAARIDRHNRLVTELADTLIDGLLQEAEGATEDGEWALAADRVDQARNLAANFYLDIKKIDQTARRHAAKARFQDLTPSDTAAIKAAVGKPVRVTLTSFEILSGSLEEFTDRVLLVEVHSGVGGGKVRFDREIPLSSVHELRVYQGPLPADQPPPP
jgi:hypothetical protein